MKIIHTVAVASLLGTLALANPLADTAKVLELKQFLSQMQSL